MVVNVFKNPVSKSLIHKIINSEIEEPAPKYVEEFLRKSIKNVSKATFAEWFSEKMKSRDCGKTPVKISKAIWLTHKHLNLPQMNVSHHSVFQGILKSLQMASENNASIKQPLAFNVDKDEEALNKLNIQYIEFILSKMESLKNMEAYIDRDMNVHVAFDLFFETTKKETMAEIIDTILQNLKLSLQLLLNILNEKNSIFMTVLVANLNELMIEATNSTASISRIMQGLKEFIAGTDYNSYNSRLSSSADPRKLILNMNPSVERKLQRVFTMASKALDEVGYLKHKRFPSLEINYESLLATVKSTFKIMMDIFHLESIQKHMLLTHRDYSTNRYQPFSDVLVKPEDYTSVVEDKNSKQPYESVQNIKSFENSPRESMDSPRFESQRMNSLKRGHASNRSISKYPKKMDMHEHINQENSEVFNSFQGSHVESQAKLRSASVRKPLHSTPINYSSQRYYSFQKPYNSQAGNSQDRNLYSPGSTEDTSEGNYNDTRDFNTPIKRTVSYIQCQGDRESPSTEYPVRRNYPQTRKERYEEQEFIEPRCVEYDSVYYKQTAPGSHIRNIKDNYRMTSQPMYNTCLVHATPQKMERQMSAIPSRTHYSVQQNHSNPRNFKMQQAIQKQPRADKQPINAGLKDLEVDLSEVIIDSIIGRGASSQVFKGQWRGAVVAIKHMQSPSTGEMSKEGSAMLKEFYRELGVMLKLRHPNLVLFMCAKTQGDKLCVITEYCSGGNLFELLHGGRSKSLPTKQTITLTWQQKLKICLDVARACQYLHTSKPTIIHRDLKSLNILLTNKIQDPKDIPTAKVSDFGLSRIKAGNADTWGPLTGMAGTYYWMAPEIILNKPYDESVDVYSFAIVMYEVFTQQIPYTVTNSKASPVSIAIDVAKGRRPDLTLVPKGCPKELLDLVQRCWSGDPQRRPQFEEISEIISRYVTV